MMYKKHHSESFKELVPVPIKSITGVDSDECKGHYIDYMQISDKRCSLKFSDSGSSVKRHNNNELCLGACILHYSERNKVLYKMLEFIKKIMDSLKIEWVLYYGGLVGLYTRDSLLPWDPDLDILVNLEDIKKLCLKDPIYTFEDSNYVFDIRMPSESNKDIIGRIVDKKTLLYSDITYYTLVDDTVKVKKMKTNKDPSEFSDIPVNKFFPIRSKSFNNGIEVPVPNDILFCLEKRYGTLRDYYEIDKNGIYYKVS